MYRFIDNKGIFLVKDPHKISYLYFPLTNMRGTFLSCISPKLAGDIKKDNERFLTCPASIEDINHNYLCRRDFFLKLAATTNKVIKLSENNKSVLEAGFLYHKITKEYPSTEIEVINFVPYDEDVEIMWVKVKNKKMNHLEFIPTSFIPLYGRSEGNLRNHRHVSSLLNRIQITKYGIILKPTILFEEECHRINKTLYFVLGYSQKERPPLGQFPTLLSFCGEEGTLVYPDAVFKNLKPFTKKKSEFDGKEACAAFRFPKEKLKRNQEVNYILIMGITEDAKYINKVFRELNTLDKVKNSLEKTKRYWQNVISDLEFDFKDKSYNGWLKWVGMQPILRKLFGCSFLPHFDYGKGGRGWRDLWQDALNLLLVEPQNIRRLIINNFQGVRIDGSNATIVTREGNFISDRNRLNRVWMDHGVWPYLTLREYIHRTGDLNILLKETTYFRDHQLKRASQINYEFNQKNYLLKTINNKIYRGSILEHILIENLVQFFNVGRHNIIRLENADWNDGLDMAAQSGESVAFSCMYAYNLKDLCSILKKLKEKQPTIEILEELLILLDRLHKPINYNHYIEKQKRLDIYLERTKYSTKGKRGKININDLIYDLNAKADWLTNKIRKKEWLKEGFFNGYYDNNKKRVEGKIRGKIRMILASQVLAIMSGIATKTQIEKIWKNINIYLKDKKIGGFRLNTDFETIYMDLGRAFGFSYGDKENGAFFNHMVVMLAYALYKRGFMNEGFEVLNSVYQMAKSSKAKIYPMIPEYFNALGRGLYFYLTGSATWYIHTLMKEVLGIKCLFGDLIIEPKLIKANFFKEEISTEFNFLDRYLKIIYIRETKSSQYKISYGYFENKKLKPQNNKLIITKKYIIKLPREKKYTIKVFLH